MDHPITKEVRRFLNYFKDDLKSKWAAGEFSKDTEWKTLQANAGAVATIGFIDMLLELDFKQLPGNQTDE